MQVIFKAICDSSTGRLIDTNDIFIGSETRRFPPRNDGLGAYQTRIFVYSLFQYLDRRTCLFKLSLSSSLRSTQPLQRLKWFEAFLY